MEGIGTPEFNDLDGWVNTLGNIFNDIKGCKSSFDLYVYILEFLQQTQIYLSVKDTDLTVKCVSLS